MNEYSIEERNEKGSFSPVCTFFSSEDNAFRHLNTFRGHAPKSVFRLISRNTITEVISETTTNKGLQGMGV